MSDSYYKTIIIFLSVIFFISCGENGERVAEKQIINFTSTKKMMDPDQYWKIISKYSPSQKEEEYLQDILNKLKTLSPEDIIGFRLRTDYYLHISYTQELWCAAYIINRGCSDDGFEYFRLWLISQGKEAFYKTLKNPDYLTQLVSIDTEFYDLELLWSVPLIAFEENFGKDLYEYISDDFEYGEGKYPEIQFKWSWNNPDSMKKICPKLMKKYNGY